MFVALQSAESVVVVGKMTLTQRAAAIVRYMLRASGAGNAPR